MFWPKDNEPGGGAARGGGSSLPPPVPPPSAPPPPAVEQQEPDVIVDSIAPAVAVAVAPAVEVTSAVAATTTTPAVVVPPPFVVPRGAVHLSKLKIPGTADVGNGGDSKEEKKWNMKKKLSKKCGPIDARTGSEAKHLRELKVPVEACEVVVRISIKKDKDGSDLAGAIESNALSGVAITKDAKSLMLTRGSLQLKNLPFGSKNLNPLTRMGIGTGPEPNLTASIFDLRGMKVSRAGELVVVAYRQSEDDDGHDTKGIGAKGSVKGSSAGTLAAVPAGETVRYALYQSPDVNSSVTPLTSAIVAAYAGVPSWAIPIAWSGELPSFNIPPELYSAWLGNDGGFSTSVYAAAVSYSVARTPTSRTSKLEPQLIVPINQWSNIIMKQQQKGRVLFKGANGNSQPYEIDLLRYARTLSGDDGTRAASEASWDRGKSPSVITDALSKALMAAALLEAGLNALAFNLVFRKLRLRWLTRATISPSRVARGQKISDDHHDIRRARARDALARALLYNVTLRDVDFQGSNLRTFGRSMGGAWAMNAQPLISRVNFTNCSLAEDDLRGLTQGLARVWCGGTALAESIIVAKNKDVTPDAWDELFLALVDPSSLSTWPRSPPPPPNMSFLQELDVRGTTAVGKGLHELSKKLHGLRAFKASHSRSRFHDGPSITDLLRSFFEAGAKLEIVELDGADASIIEALFLHCGTLREVKLDGFVGDAGHLISGWPREVPGLSLMIGASHNNMGGGDWTPSTAGPQFCPGSLTMTNDGSFCMKGLVVLASGAPGLRTLVLHKMYYWQLAHVAPVLASCGLETFHVRPPSDGDRIPHGEATIVNSISKLGLEYVESFWVAMAESKTLQDIQVPSQLIGGNASNEVAMVGRFLKKNRSVKSIGFDNALLDLSQNVDDVKVLRSAFYGNKKVTHMEYPQKALAKTRAVVQREITLEMNNVAGYKRQIKTIFQNHYSKYNSNWRAKPNQLKLPWVEKIRVSKRRIGKLNRDLNKILALLTEIKSCIEQNKHNRGAIEEQKANERLVRRGGQLQQLATKKKKVVANLVTKLNKAKARGRQQKSAKVQVPRSTYYKSNNMWPQNAPHAKHRPEHSYYRYYNDPYWTRSSCYYYGHGYHGYPHHLYPESDYDTPNVDEIPEDDETNHVWGQIYSDVEDVSCEPTDPWANVDSLVQQMETDYQDAISPQHLAAVHEACSELGIDVVQSVSQTLDTGAEVDNKLSDIQRNMDVDPEVFADNFNSFPEHQFDLSSLNLHDVPDYEVDGDVPDVDVMDADEAVDMYAGAGPRDLDDGGPSYGGSSHAALAGARRRARARKSRRIMTRARNIANQRSLKGYETLKITQSAPKSEVTEKESIWPNDFTSLLKQGFQKELIKAAAKSDLFGLPSASSDSHCLLMEWSFNQDARPYLSTGIEVALVTQCSLDRLANLEAQLARWMGKTSVAVYLKPCEVENRESAIQEVLSTIDRARGGAESKPNCPGSFDVALTLVEGCMDNEPYPINYLRNVALLEAQRQHLRFNTSLDRSAALLVDVDFRPSSNLYEVAHSRDAASHIINQRRVIVCPAFETVNDDTPETVDELKALVSEGRAEGFHLSHFPQGHAPTQFDNFWEKTMQCSDCWHDIYKVQHESLYEPYIIMSSADIPLYDERFQGYGLNKVSHLAAVSRLKCGELFVLPGVFLAAPAHERSQSWAERYGNSHSDENSFNQLALKGLYLNFTQMLEGGESCVISDSTRSKQQTLQRQISLRRDEHPVEKSRGSELNEGTAKRGVCY